eukprot:gnl/MRDRNA2_/MRDRNA2_27958_c0_seq1.p1 gnl/MRDRNA2_/MRDRNA2_27958_c0~~gnl/MRDRNA2_/MRDRNA2_27958_c0_seq1.p1  ORF type:complete len:153 (+),score=53.73 gnl/MRDRNA2_/MRDRNA2_27958_c0_seq1:70-528(+)
MQKVVLLLVPFVADALRFSEPKKPESLKKAESEVEAETEYEKACTANARQLARQHIEAKNWGALRQDVCMDGYSEELDRLESGKADVEDIGEWLDGDLKVPAALSAHKKEKKEKKAKKAQEEEAEKMRLRREREEREGRERGRMKALGFGLC